jgi:hypothetical protein
VCLIQKNLYVSACGYDIEEFNSGDGQTVVQMMTLIFTYMLHTCSANMNLDLALEGIAYLI